MLLEHHSGRVKVIKPAVGPAIPIVGVIVYESTKSTAEKAEPITA